ncbi:MAG: DASS family sodium-coupled anion symporter, partial [Bacteroidota bacterium]
VFTLGNPEINNPEGPNFIEYGQFVDTWSDSVIWLILGGFFLALAMEKTGLDVEVFKLSVKRFGKKPKNVLLSIMLATAVASMIMSNTATTAMMIASIAPLLNTLENKEPFVKALLLGVPAAAAIGGMGTIIGSPPNAIAVEAINTMKNVPFKVGFLEWMLFGVPVALVLVFIVWYILTRVYKSGLDELNLDFLTATKEPADAEEQVEMEYLKRQRRIVLGVMVVTMLLWLTGNIHGISPAMVSGLPILVFTMLSITTGDDVRTIPWDTLMLVAGGLSLGLSIQQTGLASYFVGKMENVELGFWVLVLVFAFITVLFSNIMSNTATATILIPIASIWAVSNPIVLPLVIGLSASCALFLPVSTPPNAIAFSTGKLAQADFRLNGSVAGILGPLFIMLWVYCLSLFIY